MYIALDANILCADLWLRSRSLHALRDYVQKTPSNILLHEVVLTEVRAYARRRFAEEIGRVESALKNARRLVVGMPEVDAEQALNRTLRTWERHFWMFFDDSTAQRMPRSEEVVDEAIRRSAERIAPCHADKRGATRDALIWLDLVSNGGIGGFAPGVVFISTNKKDFAGADGVSLHPRLQEDIAEHNAVLEYHSSLESFLTEHAEPVGYVTREWVEQQVDFAEVAGQVESWLYSGMSVSAFRAANDPSRAYFEPIGPPVSIASMTPMLTNFYVWRYVDGRLELHVGFDVRVEATMPCQLLTLPPTAMEGAPRDSTPGERLLECVAVLWCDLSAEVEDQEIGALTLDDVYPD